MPFFLSNEHRASMEEFRRRQRSGILVLLFTDIVGSTQLKQDLGDEQAVAIIRQHHAIIRRLLAAFPDGKEIDTAGDSFFIVFVKPSDGVKFALLVQAAMRVLSAEAGQSIVVRIGIHAGEVFIEDHEHSRKPMDLYGIQVDNSARVMSLAQGNQILLTRFVFDNARQLLKGGEIAGVGALSWLNHGPYLVKGVEEPMEICEVGEVGVAALSNPPDTEKAHRHISAGTEPVLGWRPAVGQVVPNSGWVLERELGEGGFGEVWLGRHQKLKERRVFKFCFRADRVRSLKREVTLFRLLKERGKHPNIVAIRDVFFEEPPFYIMMEYAEGEDLGKWAAKQSGLDKVPLGARLEIVAQVADALHAAHEAGIIHRDVKPSNIIVCGSYPGRPQIKLTDFGIAKVVSNDILSGVTQMGFTRTLSGSSDSGTPMYMAPELLAGKPASTGSDIYSLGVVFYQLLTGDLTRLPTMDWLRDIESPLLKEDLSKCLAGNPQERFAVAQELAQRLRAMPERRLELSRNEAENAEKLTAARRKKVMQSTVVAMGVILVIAGLTIWAVYQSSIARRETARAEIKDREVEAAKLEAETAHAALIESKQVGKAGSSDQMPDSSRIPNVQKINGFVIVSSIDEINSNGVSGSHGVMVRGPNFLNGRGFEEVMAPFLGKSMTSDELREVEIACILFCLSVDHPDVDIFFRTHPATVVTGGVIQVAVLEGGNRPPSDAATDQGDYLIRGGHRPKTQGNLSAQATVQNISEPTNSLQSNHSSSTNLNPTGAEVLSVQGTVEYLPLHSEKWLPCSIHLMLSAGDKIRTMKQSRAMVRLTDKSLMRVFELTTLEINPNPRKQGEVLDLKSGSFYFFHRDAPGDTQLKTPVSSSAIKG